MAEPILHIEGLDKKIGSKQILKQISMDVMEGEIIGLLGPNGWKNNTHPYHRRAAEAKQRKRDNKRIPA